MLDFELWETTEYAAPYAFTARGQLNVYHGRARCVQEICVLRMKGELKGNHPRVGCGKLDWLI